MRAGLVAAHEVDAKARAVLSVAVRPAALAHGGVAAGGASVGLRLSAATIWLHLEVQVAGAHAVEALPARGNLDGRMERRAVAVVALDADGVSRFRRPRRWCAVDEEPSGRRRAPAGVLLDLRSGGVAGGRILCDASAPDRREDREDGASHAGKLTPGADASP